MRVKLICYFLFAVSLAVAGKVVAEACGLVANLRSYKHISDKGFPNFRHRVSVWASSKKARGVLSVKGVTLWRKQDNHSVRIKPYGKSCLLCFPKCCLLAHFVSFVVVGFT
jgi:hypothetical protein